MDTLLLLLASSLLLVWCYTTGNKAKKANSHTAPADLSFSDAETDQTER